MQMKLLGQIFYKGSSVDCVDFIQMQMNEINHLTYIDHGQSWKTHKFACLQCKVLWYFVPRWCLHDTCFKAGTMWLMMIYGLSHSGSDITAVWFKFIQEEKLLYRFVSPPPHV